MGPQAKFHKRPIGFSGARGPYLQAPESPIHVSWYPIFQSSHCNSFENQTSAGERDKSDQKHNFCHLPGMVFTKSCICSQSWQTTFLERPPNSVVDFIIKTHVRGFFDTDLHEVSWHFATHEAVEWVLSSTDRVKISVKEAIQNGRFPNRTLYLQNVPTCHWYHSYIASCSLL